ncbi:proton-coupled folate transporter [Pectinophora gossypiella]|uniref:proton-coupled folate transporter n=1 Tax=Pectinophora gossypiella TaxID=13191 RepID=UPI00214EFB50|nr:proton-coupled folate transporter [Pectinophora gossypiella]
MNLKNVEMDLKRKEELHDEYENKRPWYKYITVEPAMFFYMMAYMITSVVEQTFYVFRACTVNHGYSEQVCYNISGHSAINKEIQGTVSVFLQWFGIASHVVPCFLAFFLGAYSDKRGRKVILLAGLLGKLYFSTMLTINAMNDWPVEYVIYTAAFPSAITGADLAIFAGCFAYLADVTTAENRTFRIGILDVAYLSTMPTGVALGNLLYNKVVNKSFTAMFAVNTSLMVLASLHCWLFLDWQTRVEQKSLREAGVRNPVTDFFDLNNIKMTLLTLTKKRPNHKRMFLWFLLISMAFYTFQRDERPVMYLYTTAVFGWGPTEFSHFRTYLSSAYVIVMLFGIPLMTKVFRWRDTLIVMLGATAHMSGHFIYANAMVDKHLYIGATAAALGPCVAPLIRSMTSKVLAPNEKGVAYAFLSVMENAVAMFASVVYSQIYKSALVSGHLNAIFYFTMATQAVVFICALIMELALKGRRLEDVADQDENRISEES